MACGAALRPGNMRNDLVGPAALNVIDCEAAPICDGIDPLDTEDLPCLAGGFGQQAEIRCFAVNLLFNDQPVLRIHGNPGVVSHANASSRLHRPCVRIGQRDPVLTAGYQLPPMRLQPCPACADGGSLFRRLQIMRRTGARHGRIRTGQLLQETLKPFITPAQFALKLGSGETAAAAVHRLDPGAVRGQKFQAKEVKQPAELHELTEHLAEGCPVRAVEIGNRLGVRTQPAQQPVHGPEPVEVFAGPPGTPLGHRSAPSALDRI